MAEELFADWLERELGSTCAETIAYFEALGGSDAGARRRLSRLTVERAMADTCPSCGVHAVLDPQVRVKLFERGGTARCKGCGVELEVEPEAVPEDPGVTERFTDERYGKLEEKPTEPKLGRFTVLPRSDGRFVVHENQEPGERMRFGPHFSTELEARWRVWWRVEGEKASGFRLGDEVLVHGVLARLADFIDARRAGVIFPATGESMYVAIASLRRVPIVVHVLHEGWPLCQFDGGLPAEWPAGHRWVRLEERSEATCKRCREMAT